MLALIRTDASSPSLSLVRPVLHREAFLLTLDVSLLVCLPVACPLRVISICTVLPSVPPSLPPFLPALPFCSHPPNTFRELQGRTCPSMEFHPRTAGRIHSQPRHQPHIHMPQPSRPATAPAATTTDRAGGASAGGGRRGRRQPRVARMNTLKETPEDCCSLISPPPLPHCGRHLFLPVVFTFPFLHTFFFLLFLTFPFFAPFAFVHRQSNFWVVQYLR
jgi:hypothetical protein